VARRGSLGVQFIPLFWRRLGLRIEHNPQIAPVSTEASPVYHAKRLCGEDMGRPRRSTSPMTSPRSSAVALEQGSPRSGELRITPKRNMGASFIFLTDVWQGFSAARIPKNPLRHQKCSNTLLNLSKTRRRRGHSRDISGNALPKLDDYISPIAWAVFRRKTASTERASTFFG